MPKKIVELEYESDDNRPGVSHKREGSNSPNFYDDDGNLVETATYRDIDEDELRERYGDDYNRYRDDEDEPHLTEQQAQIAEFLGEMIVGIVIAASPHIKSWWMETAFPGIKGFFSTAKRKVRNKFSKKEITTEVDAEIIESSRQLPSAQQMAVELREKDESYRVNMRSEEAQRSLIELLALASLMAKKVDLLSHANIVDDDIYHLDEVLGSRNILEDVNRILLDNPGVINDQTLAGLEAALNRNLYSTSGELIPIQEEEIRSLLPGNPDDDREDGSPMPA